MSSVENKLDKIIEAQGDMNITIVKLEKEVTYHIKRTDQLENKVQKIWYLVVLGAGVGLSEFGPKILKLIGMI